MINDQVTPSLPNANHSVSFFEVGPIQLKFKWGILLYGGGRVDFSKHPLHIMAKNGIKRFK